jgi:hypothetical protein
MTTNSKKQLYCVIFWLTILAYLVIISALLLDMNEAYKDYRVNLSLLYGIV